MEETKKKWCWYCQHEILEGEKYQPHGIPDERYGVINTFVHSFPGCAHYRAAREEKESG